jgi:hypothetical protein
MPGQPPFVPPSRSSEQRRNIALSWRARACPPSCGLLACCSLNDGPGSFYLIFEYVEQDLKKYMDRVEGPLPMALVKVRQGASRNTKTPNSPRPQHNLRAVLLPAPSAALSFLLPFFPVPTTPTCPHAPSVVHVPAAARSGGVPLPGHHAPRPEATERAGGPKGGPQDRGLWTGPRLLGTSAQVHARGRQATRIQQWWCFVSWWRMCVCVWGGGLEGKSGGWNAPRGVALPTRVHLGLGALRIPFVANGAAESTGRQRGCVTRHVLSPSPSLLFFFH